MVVNILGKGFIGSYYYNDFGGIVNTREDLTVKSPDVLYFISTTDNYNIYTNPYLDIDTNLTTLIKFLENAKNFPDVTVNFISSWFVYGDVPSPAKEISYCNPIGFYSITKRAAEQLLITYCKTFDIKYRIIRLANVLGLGDNKVSHKKNALTYLIRRLKTNQKIVLQQDGKFFRDYIHVKDACSAINLIITKSNYNEIYNVGTQNPLLFKDAIDYVAKKINSKSIIESDTSTKVTELLMDCTKIKNLGFVPQYSTMYQILDELIQE